MLLKLTALAIFKRENLVTIIFVCTILIIIHIAVQTSDTVNREYFDVKIFSDSLACAKIKRTKYMRNINDNAVQGRLSENYLTRNIIA